MLEALGIAALVLACLSSAFLVLLVARRVSLGRAERRREEAELRLRPLALSIVSGEDAEDEELTTEEQAILAELVGRLSRNLAGDARRRIADYFSGTSAFGSELHALADRRAWRRATAAYRLGDMASPDAIPSLVSAIEDPDPDVRAAAARSLGRLEASEATEALVEALVAEAVPRALAVRAVLDVGTSALPSLRRLAAADDPDIRATAIELIGRLGGPADGDLVIEAMDDPSAEVRARAAAALGRLAESKGAAALTRALGDRIYFVRLHAARALGQIGEPDAIPLLLRQAREDRFEAARAAADAAARIAPDALLAAAEAPDAGPHLHEAADLLRV